MTNTMLTMLLALLNGFLTDSGALAGAPVIFGPAASTDVLAGHNVPSLSSHLSFKPRKCECGADLPCPNGQPAPGIAAADVRAIAASSSCPVDVRAACFRAIFSVPSLCGPQDRDAPPFGAKIGGALCPTGERAPGPNFECAGGAPSLAWVPADATATAKNPLPRSLISSMPARDKQR